MKTSELRIGSIVNIMNRGGKVHIPDPTPFKVFIIEPFSVKVSNAANNFAQTNEGDFFWVDANDISPISLDEKWLSVFNFKMYPWRWVFVDEQHFSIRLTIKRYQYEISGGCGPIIDQVHKLQNLYQSLTGRELGYSLGEMVGARKKK